MPQVECSHRVGYNSVPYRFTSILPIPHTLFLPPLATRLLPRSETQWGGVHRLHRFFPVKPFFVEFPPFILSTPHFFSFSQEKYAIYAIYEHPLCFEPKFDRRVKNKV